MRELPIPSWPPQAPATPDSSVTPPATSSRRPTAAGIRASDLENLAGQLHDLEEENSQLRSQVDLLHSARSGGRADSSSRMSSARSEDGRQSLSRRNSGAQRRSTAVKETAIARLNEALLENEEVLQKNQELQEQVLELRRAQQAERERRAEQDLAVQDLMSRVKLLENEKLELQNDLQGSNEKLTEIIQRSKLRREPSWGAEALDAEASPHIPDQPEAEPWPHSPWRSGCSGGGDFDTDRAMEAGSQEVQILGLQEDLARLQSENQQLLGMCKELRAMFEAERQAAEQARRESERLQGKLASEKMRRRAFNSATRSSARSSSSRSQESDLMHQLVRASFAQEELADSASASSAGGGNGGLAGEAEAAAVAPGGGLCTMREEPSESSQGACDWLRGTPDEQFKGLRPLAHELVEAPSRAGELGHLPEEPWWWGRLFGSMLCCTRPPPAHVKRPPQSGGPVPIFKGGSPSFE